MSPKGQCCPRANWSQGPLSPKGSWVLMTNGSKGPMGPKGPWAPMANLGIPWDPWGPKGPIHAMFTFFSLMVYEYKSAVINSNENCIIFHPIEYMIKHQIFDDAYHTNVYSYENFWWLEKTLISKYTIADEYFLWVTIHFDDHWKRRNRFYARA